MSPLLLALGGLLIASGFGRQALGRITVLENYPVERFVYSSAVGLGTAAYGTYLLGLAGLLSFWPLTAWWILLGLIGSCGSWKNARDIQRALQGWGAWGAKGSGKGFPLERRLTGFCALILITTVLIALTACFQPPGPHEWDSLAYHLADPKIFLQQHAIHFLPTQHHSNFPFTMEMLFTCGLLYGGRTSGYVLANMIPLCMVGLLVAGLIAFSTRVFSPVVGWVAAAMLMTTPVVLWEAGIAYSDIGLALYATFGAFCAVSAILIRAEPVEALSPLSVPPLRKQRDMEQWLLLAGLMIGWALGIKYTALIYGVLLGILLIANRIRVRAIGIFCVAAVSVGAPWYIKNILWTANPVYPFAYGIFTRSRYWSSDRAASYQGEQSSFGYPHSLSSPLEALRNLIDAPWQIVAHPHRYGNPGDITVTFWIGGIFTAAFLASACVPGKPTALRILLWLLGMEFTAWFFMAQFVRYLIPVLPLAAITGGWILSMSSRTVAPEAQPKSLPNALQRLTTMLSFFLLTGQFAVLLWSVFFVPVSGRDAAAQGLLPSALSVPANIRGLLQEGGPGKEPGRFLDIYPAITWINENTPANAGVILYDDVRGYYLDRAYLWGNPGHSGYIPYGEFNSALDLTHWLLHHNIHYALINLSFAGVAPLGEGRPDDLRSVSANIIASYHSGSREKSDWSSLIRDALKSRIWIPVYMRRNVVVCQLKRSQ